MDRIQTITLNHDKWVRSPNGILAGVSQGLGDSFGIDPLFIRLAWFAAFLAGGAGLVGYILLAICLPREDLLDEAYQKKILGVCARVANKVDKDVGLVRLAACILAMVSFGVTALAYAVLHFVLSQNVQPIRLKSYR